MLTVEQITARLRALLAEIEAPAAVQQHQEPVQQQTIGGGSTVVVDTSAFTKMLRMELPSWVVGPSPNKHLYTANAGHFMPRDAVILAITTPAVLGKDAFGSLGWSDVGGDPIQQRRVVLSDVPGDFTKGLPGTGAIVIAADNGSLTFSAGPNSAGYPALTIPNHTYYFNIRNVNPSEPTPTGHFDLDIEFRNPR